MLRRQNIFCLLAQVAMGLSQAQLELRVREMRRRAVIKSSAFPEQQAVMDDPCRFKVAWTTRRAGKTYTAVIDWVLEGMDHPFSQSLYLGFARKDAKRRCWPIIKQVNRMFDLGIHFNEVDLVATLPNGSVLELYGVDKPGLDDKLHGTKLLRVYIDEAAFYRVDLLRLFNGAILDAVSDLQGEVWLMSTPGYLTRGLFFELTKSFDWRTVFQRRRPPPTDFAPGAGRWSVHRWTTEQNPHMEAIFAQEIADARAADPDVEKNPEFLRNKRGAWVHTTGEQVYTWDADKNTYRGEWKQKPGDHYGLGMDYGHDDAAASSLCVWREDTPLFVELESTLFHAPSMSELAGHVRGHMEIHPDIEIVGDPGSKAYFEELRRAHELPIMPAEKSSKFDWIQIKNSAYRAGQCQMVDPASSPHVREIGDLVWRVKPDGTKEEAQGLPNNACDAHLYIFRHARHYMRPETGWEPHTVLTREQHNKRLEDAMIALEESEMEDDNEPRWNE